MSSHSQAFRAAVPLALLGVFVACSVEVEDVFLAPGAEDPRACDEGDCNACQQCALLDGPCVDEYQATLAPEPLAYATCTTQCVDGACVEACAAAEPEGAAIFQEYVDCQLCLACFQACAGVGCQ